MIKINLLPPHIRERQYVRSVLVLVVVVILLQAGILGLTTMKMKGDLADHKAELEYWEAQAAKVGQVDGRIGQLRNQAGFLGAWPQWERSVDTYHQAWIDTLSEIARWIYAKIQVNSLAPTPTGVQIQGATDTLEDFKVAYLNIQRSPLYTNVSFSISGVSGGWSAPTGPGGAPAARPAAGVAAAPAGAPAMGLALGRREDDDDDRRGPMPMGMPPAAAPTPAAPAAPGVAAPPIGVSFTCALNPQYGSKLNPPPPPGGAAAVPGAPAAPALAPGAPAALPPGGLALGRRDD